MFTSKSLISWALFHEITVAIISIVAECVLNMSSGVATKAWELRNFRVKNMVLTKYLYLKNASRYKTQN